MPEPPRDVDFVASAVIGAALEVHRHLGPGFLESVYERALSNELAHRNIVFERQKVSTVFYKTRPVGDHRVDFLVECKLIVELKAIERIMPIHQAQLISYLKAANLSLGLLINFNVKWLRDGIQRVVLT